MSSAGHVFSMLATLKNNNRRKRKNFKELREHFESYKNARLEPIKESVLSKDEMQILKDKIRTERKRDFQRNLVYSMVAMSVILFVAVFLLRFGFKLIIECIQK